MWSHSINALKEDNWVDRSSYDVVRAPQSMPAAVVPCRVSHGRKRFADGCAQGRRPMDGEKAAGGGEARHRPGKGSRNAFRQLVCEPVAADDALGDDSQSCWAVAAAHQPSRQSSIGKRRGGVSRNCGDGSHSGWWRRLQG